MAIVADRVAEHIAAFNAAVASGEWTGFVQRFAQSARLEFNGVPAGPYEGREAIAAAYRSNPPDDTMVVLDVRSTDWTDTARFQWSGGGTGTLWLAWTASGLVSRLVVDFD
jgi:steroid delta-isomerase